MKPRLTVTKILSYLYPYEETKISDTLKFHGRMAHQEICDNYNSNDYDCEVELELERKDYILVGRVDIIDHQRALILEAKPRSTFRNVIKSKRARLQLSAYVAMWRKLVLGTIENGYYGAWLVYNWKNPRDFAIVKPFYLDMRVLNLFDEIAKRIIEEEKNIGNRPSKDSEVHIRGTRKRSTVLDNGEPSVRVREDSRGHS